MRKGKDSFSFKEIEKIRELIVRKCSADRSEQKTIRSKMRRMDFYISDFTDDITSVEEFDILIADGKIKCSDEKIADLKSDDSHTTMNSKADMKANQRSDSNLKEGLAPLVGENPRVLILGSLPGYESLMLQQYYSKKGNRFWEVIYSLFDKKPQETYAEKTQFLKEHGIALWDVFGAAEREGSLDSNINQEVPNDIKMFLNEYPTVNIIAFNGQKAATSFESYFQDLEESSNLKLLTLPSSSGANRQFSFEKMKEEWKKILESDFTKF
ncbi:MAG: DNA-deoxyinosine glycosylase [Muribaculaceae bacterium]|nr:DNA-deoxyinosine glycosylase [Muribaculaceae bacterium]